MARRPPRLVVLACGHNFCLLSAYYILQPIRDDVGLLLGKDMIPILFRWSLVAMLVVNPLYAIVLRRIPRERLVKVIHRFFSLHLLLFSLGFTWLENSSWLPGLFYVWVSVFNLFVVSLFWSRMADIFDSAEGKRVFGLIGAGGSLGQLFGSVLAGTLVQWVGPTLLLPISVVLLEISLRLADYPAGDAPPKKIEPWSGVVPLLRSPYLLGICAYIFLYTVTSSFLYFQKQALVADNILSREDRVSFFSALNFAGSLGTILVQALVAGPFLSVLGLTTGLSLVPLVTVLGFLALRLQPTLQLAAIFEVTRRTLNYAIARPSREVLFTVVDREQKYATKNFIDTFVYRAGDAAASFSAPFLAVPSSAVWLGVGIWLGWLHRGQAVRRSHCE